MKKIISLILLSLILVSCGKQTDYYFEDVTSKMTLPPMEGTRTFEILIKKDCIQKDKFNTTTNQIEKVHTLCEATINDHRFFRVMKEDRKYEFYELIDFGDTPSGDWEWKLSTNTF